MKMHIWTLFVGLFFVLWGASMIMRAFGITFPLGKIAMAALFIFIGISILFPGKFTKGCCGSFSQSGRETMFSENNVSGKDVSGQYSTVFGSNKLDLTQIELKEEIVRIKVDVVFGGAEIKIDQAKPVKIIASSAFGGVSLPNGNAAAFGTNVYQTASYKEGEPHILIYANAVFGGIEIK